MFGNDMFFIMIGLCGFFYVEVEVIGLNCDLYFGFYGGCVVNLINILMKMIVLLYDEDQWIIILGFYDDVIELLDVECVEMVKVFYSEEKYKVVFDIKVVYGEKGYSMFECGFICFMLDVNGIWGGYIGEGVKMVIFFKVFVKIFMWFVLGQEFGKIIWLFVDYFKVIVLDVVSVEVKLYYGGDLVVILVDLIGYQVVSKVYEVIFGKKLVLVRSGGSIFIIVFFEEVLGLKMVMMGFGFDLDVIYLLNEYYGLFNFYKGIEIILYFYYYFV